MSNPKDRRLGRGLAALLGTPLDEEGAPMAAGTDTPAASSVPEAPRRSGTLPGAAEVAAAVSAAAPGPSSGAGAKPLAPAPSSVPAPSSATAPPNAGSDRAAAMDPADASTATSGGSAVKKPRGVPASPGSISAASASAASASAGTAGAIELSVYEIDNNPFQPRRQFNPNEIASLAESLKEHQQLQPVLVRRVGDRYQLISGERRLRAAIHAGLATVRAEVREADDRLVAELAIIENLQRKDLNAIEKALSFRRYIDQHRCTQEDLAKRLKIDRSTIANLMRLLELPQGILDAIQSDRLSAGHARALLPLGDERQQLKLAGQIEEERWSVRQTEHYVAERLKAEEAAESGAIGPATSNKKSSVTPQIESLQQELKMHLGTKVEIRQTARGRGKITIHFANPDEFQRLRAALAGSSAATARQRAA